jgi:hypothetical protein
MSEQQWVPSNVIYINGYHAVGNGKHMHLAVEVSSPAALDRMNAVGAQAIADLREKLAAELEKAEPVQNLRQVQRKLASVRDQKKQAEDDLAILEAARVELIETMPVGYVDKMTDLGAQITRAKERVAAFDEATKALELKHGVAVQKANGTALDIARTVVRDEQQRNREAKAAVRAGIARECGPLFEQLAACNAAGAAANDTGDGIDPHARAKNWAKQILSALPADPPPAVATEA